MTSFDTANRLIESALSDSENPASACDTDNSGVRVLMPSTPSAYPQVDGGHFAASRVVNSAVIPAQVDFWAWFDSRQLHQGSPDLEQQVRAFSLSMG